MKEDRKKKQKRERERKKEGYEARITQIPMQITNRTSDHAGFMSLSGQTLFTNVSSNRFSATAKVRLSGLYQSVTGLLKVK